MKRLFPLSSLFCVGVLLLGGCSPRKPAVVSDNDRLLAENYISTAQFSMQVHQYARAEGLFQQAIDVRGDYPEYWVGLGMARAAQKNPDGARKAYEKALKFFKARYYWGKDVQDLGQGAWVMALLGQTDDAVKFLNNSLKDHPDNAYLKQMADPQHGLPKTFQTDDFKQWMAK